MGLPPAGRVARILREEGASALAARIARRLRLDRPRRAGSAPTYAEWLATYQPRPEDLERLRLDVAAWSDRPLVSVLMPTYNSKAEWLRDAIASVRAQTYDRWQLCIADDASSDPHLRPTLEELAAEDPRIEVGWRDSNGGIGAASATAQAMAAGEWVALLDHDDVLQPHALQSVVAAIRQDPELDMVYSDEDKLLTDGRRGDAFFKPGWSPDLLLSVNYLAHLTVIRRSLLEAVGGFRSGFDGSQDYDLFLRASERARRVGHVDDVLYSWRQVPGSAALSAGAKPYAYEAAERALEAALERRRYPGWVQPAAPGWYHVRYQLAGTPSVTLVVRGDAAQAFRVAASTAYNKVEVVAAGSSTNRLAQAAREASGDHVVFLDGRLDPLEADWLESLLEHSQRAEVGAVGGRILGPGRRPQQEGLTLGGAERAAAPLVLGGYFQLGESIRNVAALSLECLAIRRTLLEDAGSLDSAYSGWLGGADLCLRLRQAGRWIVYTPLATFRRRARPSPPAPADLALLRSRWSAEGGLEDPFLNPHLRVRQMK